MAVVFVSLVGFPFGYHALHCFRFRVDKADHVLSEFTEGLFLNILGLDFGGIESGLLEIFFVDSV